MLGLFGIVFKVDLGLCYDIDMYVEGYIVMDVLKLLLNMLDVVCVFDVDVDLKFKLGDSFFMFYVKMKK